MYMYISFFVLNNAKLQPSTSKIVLSQSLFFSFMFLHHLTSNICLYVHMGVMLPRL